jgi:LPS export ABC transporter protein LptC
MALIPAFPDLTILSTIQHQNLILAHSVMSHKFPACSVLLKLIGIAAVIPLFVLVSCSSDLKKVQELTKVDSLPDISISKIVVKQSESGFITLELTAPQLRAYQGKDPYTEFPKGLKMVFFDSLMRPKSELTANYGISWDNRKIMEAKGNVVLKNFPKAAQLNTEHLTWNEAKRKMTTESSVKITTPEKIITGKSMESDELFDNWTIRHVSGTFYVNEQK